MTRLFSAGNAKSAAWFGTGWIRLVANGKGDAHPGFFLGLPMPPPSEEIRDRRIESNLATSVCRMNAVDDQRLSHTA
jgi:hypothetical protein